MVTGGLASYFSNMWNVMDVRNSGGGRPQTQPACAASHATVSLSLPLRPGTNVLTM